MNSKIPDDHLERFSDFVSETMGLHFPPARWPDLNRGIVAAADEQGMDDPVAFMQQLASQPPNGKQLQTLACHLTVGETYFFREKASLEILSDQIIPELMNERRGGRRHLRIWSAACCTGEEAYSIAITLRQAIPDLNEWNVLLLATDINSNYLRTAAAGVYGEWSFRNAPVGLKERYFKKLPGGRFEIAPEIRRMVRFANLNLAADTYSSLTNDTHAIDVIFCRNVLMYFTPPRAQKIVERFYRVQANGGWLIVGASESPHISFPPYVTVNFTDVTLHRKVASNYNLLPGKTIAVGIPPSINEPRAVEFSAIIPPIGPSETARLAATVALPDLGSEESFHDLCEHCALLFKEGRYGEVVENLNAPLSERSLESPAFALMVRSLANLGRSAEALNWCNRWIAVNKLESSAHYLRGIILQERREVNEAIGSLRAALYLDPNFIVAHLTLGTIARDAGEHGESRKHLKNALALLGTGRIDAVVPESDGITAGQLIEMIRSLTNAEALP